MTEKKIRNIYIFTEKYIYIQNYILWLIKNTFGIMSLIFYDTKRLLYR